MTQTLTTKQLNAIAAGEFDACSVLDASVSMARELLASREAQPVAYLKKPIIDSERFDSADPEIILHPNTPEGWHSEYQAVFAAPPARAVPDERAAFNAWNNEDNLPIAGIPAKNAAWLAWQARAMLAQPVSQRYKLPPHDYRELVNVLRDTAVKYNGTDQLRERLNTALSKFIEPDHPHTRTAPQERN